VDDHFTRALTEMFNEVIAEARLPMSYDCIGEQLGQAIAPMIEELASTMYDCARGDSFGHMPEGRATALMLSLHLELVREDE
jgi:hypothetical protein